MIKDLFQLTIKNIRGRRLRSYLTVFGVVIGITAIVALITLGEGLQQGVAGQFDRLGTKRIFVGPKEISVGGPPSGVSPLTESDMEAVASIPQVEYVSPIYVEGVEVSHGSEKGTRDVFSYDPEIFEKAFRDVAVDLEDGRYLQAGDTDAAVIGWGMAHDFFDKEIHVRSSIDLNGRKFRVVGITAKQGNRDQDYAINVPIDSLRDLFDNPKAISAFSMQIKPGVDIDQVAARVERTLKRHRDDENFQVTSPVKLKEQTSAILGVVKWVFVGIAFISLIVGAIGITNSMYTSVLERTRHIGVMKAIGARNRDVLLLFLIESGLLGLIGGVIGVALGATLSALAIAGINAAGVVQMAVTVRPSLIIFGLVFSFITGMAAGFFPALRAAKMQPVDALRYE